MTPGQVARARHYAYSLFGQLYLQGITAPLFSYLQAIPELARAVGTDLDRAGAEYQRLFGFNLFPFESIFLDTTGLLGGQISEAVLDFYRRAEFHPDLTTSSPDHIGHEMGLLAHLCQIEADCWLDDRISNARQNQERQWRFLRGHLLRWMQTLLISIEQHNSPFYAALAKLTGSLVNAHYIELERIGSRPETGPDFALPAVPPLLDDKQTGLKEIANYLLTPAYSGIFLSGDNIVALAREQDLPRGFGTRQQILVNLMRAAIQYNTFPNLLKGLIAMFEGWQGDYRNWVHQDPQLASFASAWESRTIQTITILHQMQCEAPIWNKG